MNKSDELKLRLESNEVFAMYEIVINILAKYSKNLYLADNFNTLFSPFILCRYLSMKNELLPYAEYLSTVYSTSKLSNVEFYKLAYALIPKQRNSFIRYIKKSEKKKTKTNDNIINNTNDIFSNLMEL
jgi:hypothetical protein